MGETAVKKIIEIKEEKTIPLEFDTKHLESFKALEQYKEAPKPRSEKFTTVEIQNVTRKSSILFFLLPEWDPSFPPYNLARLSAVTKAAGYKTHVVDLNVEAYNAGKSWPTDIDFWHGQSEWRWTGNNYWNFIHPHLLPLLEKYLNYIGEYNATVLGFTIYYCNIELVNWFITEAKKRYPNIAIMAGGPQAHHSYWTPNKDIDYVVSGEGEENILKVLQKAKGMGITSIALLGKDGGQAVDLSDFAIVVQSEETARIQEIHLLLGHTLCEYAEIALGMA